MPRPENKNGTRTRPVYAAPQGLLGAASWGRHVAVENGRQVWVPIKRICEALRVDPSTQILKLKDCVWAVVGLIPITGSDGKGFSSWLAGIETSRVNPSAKPLLERFQLVASDALDQLFKKKSESEKPIGTVVNSSSFTAPDGGSLVITNMTVEEEVEKEATLEQCALFVCGRPSTSVEMEHRDRPQPSDGVVQGD